MTNHSNWQTKLVAHLFRPIDAGSLVAFRIAFGVAMLWEAWRYLKDDWVTDLWIAPKFHFFFPLFGWVHPWPGNGLVWQFYGMGLLAACIALGLCYRLSMALYCLAFTYVFLLDAAYFQNHFYLIALVSFLMVFVPANCRLSLDAVIRPTIARATVPAWSVWLLRFQMGLPYFFGGVAKLNGDWMQGQPMHLWLASLQDFPLPRDWLASPALAYLLSYSGIAIDLAAVPLLLYRRTRPYMFVVLLMFHFTNARLFEIGVFPWLAIGATTIFFPPDWPQTFWHQVSTSRLSRFGVGLGGLVGVAMVWWWSDLHDGVAIAIGAFGTALAAQILIEQWGSLHQRGETAIAPVPNATDSTPVPVSTPTSMPERHQARWRQQAIVALLGVWAIVHLTLPLRHYFIPGDASWTEEGHRFAWRMKLRSKEGWVVFRAINPDTGTEAIVDPLELLAPWQYDRMLQRPYLIHQFALYLETVIQDAGIPNPQLYARSHISLNGRPHQFLIDPTVDLTKEPANQVPAPWIFPLQQPSS